MFKIVTTRESLRFPCLPSGRCFFLKVGQPRPLLSLIFGLSKQTSLQLLQQIYVKVCPSSINYFNFLPKTFYNTDNRLILKLQNKAQTQPILFVFKARRDQTKKLFLEII